MIGYDPEGHELVDSRDLPESVEFNQVIIRNAYICIDGWFLLNDRHTKGGLQWFHRNIADWLKSHPEPHDKKWMEGIVDTFTDALGKKL